jgi:hypothetical protein
MPNLNEVASMDLVLTDATGSGADLVPVAIRPLREEAAAESVTVPAAVPNWQRGPYDQPAILALDEAFWRM